MGYVAVKGGTEAISFADKLVDFYRLKSQTEPASVKQIIGQFRHVVSKIMGEASLYSEEYAAIAFKQAEGDVLEAAFILRAFRASLERKYYTENIETSEIELERRISSSFKEIPGGQILGPTRDYSPRVMNFDLSTETFQDCQTFLKQINKELTSDIKPENNSYGKVTELLIKEGILKKYDDGEDEKIVDVTKDSLKFPAPRSARLQMMARAETGGLMTLAYSAIRGLTAYHPTVGELRIGFVKIYVTDKYGEKRYIGKVRLTEVEMISKVEEKSEQDKPFFTIGYGLCFGHNETKAISMGILDRAMRTNKVEHPFQDQEFVLYHTEGIDALGFTNHLKLPHYVTFQASLDNVRKVNAVDENVFHD